MKDIVIAGAARTAIGRFSGTLKDVQAVKLGETAVLGAMERSGLRPDEIDEMILGNVLTTGLGQNPARQVVLNSGCPVTTVATTINKVCASGLKSVAMAAQTVNSDDADIVMAGGFESMSQSPYYMPNARFGARMGDVKMMDSMVNDGLTDAFNSYHMGVTAENVAEKFSISREDQDTFAFRSQEKTQAALKQGRFKDEIVPVMVPQRKKDPLVFEVDEHPRATTVEILSKLRPAFKDNGTVTAGNASGINDSGAAVAVMTKENAEKRGLKPLVRIVSYAAGGVDPALMGTGPIPATEKALKKAGLKASDLDLIEANEAFAAQAIAVNRHFGFDDSIVNVNGGAIALGHPIGASGCRILITLIHEMMKRKSGYGLATLCIGGGQGFAMIVERI